MLSHCSSSQGKEPDKTECGRLLLGERVNFIRTRSGFIHVYALCENEAARQTVFCQKTVLGVFMVLGLFCGCCGGGVNST